MIASRSSKLPQAGRLIGRRHVLGRRRWFEFALAALIPGLAAVGCGTKPPPPGAEKETSDLDVDLGSDVKSPAEESELLHKPGAAGSQGDAPADVPGKPESTEDETTDAKDQ